MPVLYAAWKEFGVISQEELMTYRQFGSVLEGHPTLRFKYVEAATGSLALVFLLVLAWRWLLVLISLLLHLCAYWAMVK